MDTYDIFDGVVSQKRFASAYNRPVTDEIAPMSELSITETAYIPPEVQIKDMMDAGVRLAQERKARFQAIQGEEGEPEVPLEMRSGVDIVDVAKMATEVEERLAEQQLAAQAKAKKESEEADNARIQAAVAAAIAAQQTPVK